MFFMTMVQMPFFIPERFAGTPGEVGLATGLANLAAALIAMTFHRFKARLSYPGIFAFIFATMGAGYALAAFAPDFPVLLAAMLIAGCGFGLIVPAQSAWMMATVAPAQRGLGIGLVTAAMFLGQFAAPMAIEPFIAPDDPGHVFVLAAQMLAALAVLYAAIAAGGWCLARSQP
jgi:predicted MFS family arabinose efflux permease